jgi:hypothetical protein
MMFLAMATALVGCHREQISVYTAPKDDATPATTQNDGQNGPADSAARPRPEVGWNLPSGWTETGADQVSLENFTVRGSNGQEARVSLTELPNLTGKEVLLVNMWRQQAGLTPLSDDDALKSITPTQFGAEQGSYFEVLGTNDGRPFEIATAFLHRPDGSWFCRISGEPDLIAEQKPVFIDFLKTIRIQDGEAVADNIASSSTSSPTPNWTVPSQWQAQPPGEMQVARFIVPEHNNAKAEVSVSVFPTEAGGTLANINRWRTKFVGLAPVEQKDLPQLVSPLDPAHPGSVLVDMQKDDKRLIGAIVPRSGNYWFYKLVGEAAAVGPQKDSFIAFAKSDP